MKLSGFNAEPEWNDLVSGECNHLQMIFYKLKQKYVRTISPIPLLHTLTKPYASLIVILSLYLQMTSRIVTVIFSI
jgi:hypothetical protein